MEKRKSGAFVNFDPKIYKVVIIITDPKQKIVISSRSVSNASFSNVNKMSIINMGLRTFKYKPQYYSVINKTLNIE